MHGLAAELWRRDRVLAAAGALHLAAVPAMAVMALLDGRMVARVEPAINPFELALSSAIFLWTLAWLLGHLTGPRRLLAIIRWGVAVATGSQMVCVVLLRSAQGLSLDPDLDVPLLGGMGVAIALVTLLVAVALLLFFGRPDDLDALAPAYLWGVRVGLLVFLFGSAAAALMLARSAQGTDAAEGGPGLLPFVSWGTRALEARLIHVAGLGALQALPLVGWLAGRRGGALARRVEIAYVGAFALLYAAALAALLAQALGGQSVADSQSTGSRSRGRPGNAEVAR